ncbi:MAG: amidohydrolase [Acetatifactor sp.]
MIDEIIKYIEKYKQIFWDLSDAIFEHPETKYQEYFAVQEMVKLLRTMGFVVQEAIGGIDTAFLTSYRSENIAEGSPCVAFLAEYDALPGYNQKPGVYSPERYENENGTQNGHGCGHNLLGCGSALAFVAAAEYWKNHHLQGELRLYGCPAEEGGAGKSRLVQAGCFDDVSCAFTWHPADYHCITSGSSLANCQIQFSFAGKSAHAAIAPHLGRSALDAAELMNVGCNYLREHIVPEARIHYAYQNAGGILPGAIPEEASVLYQIRAPKREDVEEITSRIIKVAEGAALMTETLMSYEIKTRVANIKPHHALERLLYDCMQSVPLPEYTVEERKYAEKLSQCNGENTLSDLLPRCEKIYGTSAEIQSHMKDTLYDFLLPYLPDDQVHSYSSDVGDVSQICPTAQFAGLTWVANTYEHTWVATSQGKSTIAHKGMAYAASVLALAACKKNEKNS